MDWKFETFGNLLKESRVPCVNPDSNKRLRVKLNVLGVEKRPLTNEKEGATRQFKRKAGQFIYGKQNFHKGAFGIIPIGLDGFESSADIPSFDLREDCLPEWIYYFFKSGNRYLELEKFARGVGSKRIHPEQLQDYEIPLPSIENQKMIIENLKNFEKDIEKISTELTHQLSLISQLRQAFLREAMQGTLVSNETSDGKTGADLLEEIKKEKEQLIKDKKIKKGKPLPPISEEEIPFEIPDNWVWCRLWEIQSEFLSGTAFQSARYSRLPTNNFVIRLGNVKNDLVNENIKPAYIDEEYASNSKKFLLLENDLLITMTGTRGKKDFLFTALVGKVAESNLYLNQRVGCIRFLKVNSKYLNKLMKLDFVLNPIFQSATGAANQANVGVEAINKAVIPLPPLEIQNRIVDKLDELMQYCDALEASVKESQNYNAQLLQQVLREALEGKEESKQEAVALVAEDEEIYQKKK